MERILINKKEIWTIVLVLLACFVTILYYKSLNGEKIAKITVDGNLFSEINLSKNKEEYVIDIQSQGKMAHIKVSKDSIGFIDYECPDGICQSAGMIKSELQTAICLPIKVSIIIYEKGTNTSLDAISG